VSQLPPSGESMPEQPESGKVPHPTDPRRWADGTQRAGVDSIARKHPHLKSDTAAIRQQIQDKAESHIADRGGRDNLSAAVTDACGELAFVLFLLSQWREHFIDKGLTTKGGRVRSAYSPYLATLDRYIRLAQLVGLERRARRAMSPADWLQSLPDPLPQTDDAEHEHTHRSEADDHESSPDSRRATGQPGADETDAAATTTDRE
jgi:hypothetical protein